MIMMTKRACPLPHLSTWWPHSDIHPLTISSKRVPRKSHNSSNWVKLIMLQVRGLKSSLNEANELASSSTSNLERHEAKHQVEMENMKVRFLYRTFQIFRLYQLFRADWIASSSRALRWSRKIPFQSPWEQQKCWGKDRPALVWKEDAWTEAREYGRFYDGQECQGIIDT